MHTSAKNPNMEKVTFIVSGYFTTQNM
jgi:hypothetical protein